MAEELRPPNTHDQRILMAIYGELCKINQLLSRLVKALETPKEPKPRKSRKTATKKEG